MLSEKKLAEAAEATGTRSRSQDTAPLGRSEGRHRDANKEGQGGSTRADGRC